MATIDNKISKIGNEPKARIEVDDAYIVVKWRIIVEGTNDTNERNRSLNFKNNAPFRSCISKINNTFETLQKILISLCRCIIC